MERTLIHEPTYAHALDELGTDLQRLDDALAGVEWALSTNPEVYEPVKGTACTRLLKTDGFAGLPPLRVWFRVSRDGQCVHLEYIEAVEE